MSGRPYYLLAALLAALLSTAIAAPWTRDPDPLIILAQEVHALREEARANQALADQRNFRLRALQHQLDTLEAAIEGDFRYTVSQFNQLQTLIRSIQ